MLFRSVTMTFSSLRRAFLPLISLSNRIPANSARKRTIASTSDYDEFNAKARPLLQVVAKKKKKKKKKKKTKTKKKQSHKCNLRRNASHFWLTHSPGTHNWQKQPTNWPGPSEQAQQTRLHSNGMHMARASRHSLSMGRERA